MNPDSKIKYTEFKQASSRVDSSADNLTHYFSLYVAVPLAFLCHRFGLNPNQVTGLFLGVGCLSDFALYFQQGILGYILWRIHLILDMGDGSLTRATRTFSATALFVGDDWYADSKWETMEVSLKELDCRVFYFPYTQVQAVL